jgi:hypothetical protein
MPIDRSTLTTIGVAACCVCSMVTSPAAAQSRFEVLGADTVAAIAGLNVYTIRDNQMASCYTVFVIDPADAPSTVAVQEPPPPPTPEQLEKARVAQTLKDAIATRERKVVELQKRIATMWNVEFETARERIDDDYERVVRRVLPELYPSAQIAPGWRTSRPDELNSAVRRAIAEGDAAVGSAAAAGVDEPIDRLLNRRTASARLAVSGPLTCPPFSERAVR